MAMCLLHGGSGFPYLAPPMYDYLCGEDASSIKVSAEDVPNVEVTQLLQKVTTQCVCPARVTVVVSATNLVATNSIYIYTTASLRHFLVRIVMAWGLHKCI